MDQFVVREKRPAVLDTAQIDDNVSTVKRRKFNDEWTELYFFVENKGKPYCLLCSATVSELHAGKLKRHFESQHKNIASKYPESSDSRLAYVKKLQAELHSQRLSIKQVLNESETIVMAGLQICWRLARSKKPFTESEIVKECMVDAVRILSSGLFSF